MLQLETIYVLEGLGPPKEDTYGQQSFSDQVHILRTHQQTGSAYLKHAYCYGPLSLTLKCLGLFNPCATDRSQVKADHKSELHNFRDILLGSRRPA